MVLRIFEMIATSGFLTALECTGGDYSASPDPVAGLRGPTSKGERRKGKRMWEEGNGKHPPPANSWISFRSTATNGVAVPSFKLSTIGSRASVIWKAKPHDVSTVWCRRRMPSLSATGKRDLSRTGCYTHKIQNTQIVLSPKHPRWW